MSENTIAVNRQARFNYFILETFEAGIVLNGCEIKSIRDGRVNLKDSYVRLMGKEAFIVGLHISLYGFADRTAQDLDPERSRKLLLHRLEIEKLMVNISRKGNACIPLSMYFKRGIVKLEIGIGTGKKQHDKRDSIKERMQLREMKQAIKYKNKRG